ncbi:MAG: AmmeMemoRadiSam system radical SAM enzyme [Spirochaetales bacterium]|nr:AmmeMemoRadiSam system radical SAM enzyme [Spirochaetales bacterium]
MSKAQFYSRKPGNILLCELCPNNCRIESGDSGICQVRKNNAGILSLPYYGMCTAIALDPIEKKPLYHFYPGKNILSVGFLGCSFKCPFCQNFAISQSVSTHARPVSPQNLVDMALKEQSFAIAYTYSEPIVHLEYVLDTASIARAKGLKNVLVSNGYVNPKPAEELLSAMDAANIDLKSFNPDFYKEEIKGKLAPVKKFIEMAAGRIHLEVTTLIIPGKNDSVREMEEIAQFLASLDKNMPFHLSCYYPTYKYDIAATPVYSVKKLADVARKYLTYVYIGNAGGESTDTLCISCGSVLVGRRGYTVSLDGIQGKNCRKCGAVAPVAGLD